MRLDVSMDTEDEFTVTTWWAKTPEFVIKTLAQQLEAATAIWPELEAYRITMRTARARGVMGGEARAAALSPERRSEIASSAAKARWGNAASS